jgi:signal peptidase I
MGMPHRGDIVVFHPWAEAVQRYEGVDPSIPWIKRVIALPGEIVAVKAGRVLVNGQAIPDPYPNEKADYDMPARQVPAGELFVLGDNRNHSSDSHVWGTVAVDQVIGRACFRFWPPGRFGELQPAHGPALAVGSGG